MGQLRPVANTGSEFTTSLSKPWAVILRPKIFFVSFPTALTSIPTPRGGRSLIFAELGTASEEGGLLWVQVSAGWSPACPSPRLGHLGCQHLPVLCSEDVTTVRVMKAYSSSLQPNPYLALATLIIYLLMQVGTGGHGPWMTWSSLPVLPD